MVQLLRYFKKTREIFFIAHTCSGATLLENILLELGIRLRFGHDPDGYFIFNKKISRNTDEYLKTERLIPSQFGLPSLTDKVKFNFRSDIAVFFTHNKDFFSNSIKTIILVRDPRDTLLSSYKLYNQTHPSSFFDFCQNNISEWVDFYTKALAYNNFHIVRFEDLKLNPILTLRSLMSFLNLTYDNKILFNANSRSTFERTKEVEDKMIAEHPEIAKAYFPNRITKCGQCYQFALPENSDLVESFTLIENKAADLIIELGYSKSNPK